MWHCSITSGIDQGLRGDCTEAPVEDNHQTEYEEGHGGDGGKHDLGAPLLEHIANKHRAQGPGQTSGGCEDALVDALGGVCLYGLGVEAGGGHNADGVGDTEHTGTEDELNEEDLVLGVAPRIHFCIAADNLAVRQISVT